MAYIIYTSGSTGRPRGVVVGHDNLSPLLHWGYRNLEIGVGDRVLQNLSYIFDWSVLEIFITLTTGACLVGEPGSGLLEPVGQVKLLRTHGISVLHATPTQCRHLFSARLPVPTLGNLFIGAEVLTPDLLEACIPYLSDHCRVYNMYGPTEATIMTTAREIRRDRVGEYRRLGGVPIGGPVANIRLLILDRDFNLCPVGVAGMLYILGDATARGYLNRPELTGEMFFECKRHLFDRAYDSGDLVRWLPGGDVEFLGRGDQQVKIRGFRIELEEISDRLGRHPAVAGAVVTVWRDETRGDYLCAYVVFKSGEKVGDREMKDYLSRGLPSYMVPSYFVELERIPLTPSGKTDRRALPAPEQVIDGDFGAPQGEMETRLAALWADVLGVDIADIGARSDFFALGGHSLKATRIIAGIRDLYGVTLPVAVLFKNGTPRALAEVLRQSLGDSFTRESSLHNIPVERAEEREYYPLSFNQDRLWILQQRHPSSNAFHMPGAVELQESPGEGRIRGAVEGLLLRHEGLRTGFKEINGRAVQFILPPGSFGVPFENVDISTDDAPDEAAALGRFNRRPFELERPPLFRAMLLKVHDRRYIFAYNMHHIVSDGWSTMLLERDFNEFFKEGAGTPHALFSLTYKDFALWHNRQIESGPYRERCRRYWLEFLKQGTPPQRLPGDFDAPDAAKEGAAYRFVIPADVSDALETMGREHNLTLFTLTYSLYAIFLSQVTGEETVMTAILSAGRDHPDVRDIVGVFINTVLSRTRITHDTGFRDMAGTIGADLLESLEYQYYPPELVLKEAGTPYPRVEAAFNMLNFDDGEGQSLQNTTPTHIDLGQDVKFDLEPFVRKYADGIEVTITYNKNRFKAETIEYFARRYGDLAAFFAQAPNEPIKNFKKTKKRKSYKRGKDQ